MVISAAQVAAAHNKPTGMVHEVVVPSGADFKGSDFDVLPPTDARAQQYQQHLRERNIVGAERRPT